MVSLETINQRLKYLEERAESEQNNERYINSTTNSNNTKSSNARKRIKQSTDSNSTNNTNENNSNHNNSNNNYNRDNHNKNDSNDSNKNDSNKNDKNDYNRILKSKLNQTKQKFRTTTDIDLKDIIGPAFYDMHCDIRENKHTYYNLAGGRGSLKSSTISVEIVLGMMSDENANAVIYRKVKDTLATSVYEQIIWAIDVLGVSNDWHCTKSPLMCMYKPSGTKILFKGLDKAKRSKSMKFAKGYAKYLWFEEFDEFDGGEEIRSVQQSVLRGGTKFFVFRSMNPPKSKSNWANDYMETESLREDTYTSHTTYLSAPVEWLGQQFIDDAEWLKETKPEAYSHEYLGEMIGTGADVFDNIISRRISDDEIFSFSNIYMGVDWGWYPDPYRWVAMNYDSRRRILIIYDEYSCNKRTNEQTFAYLTEEKHIPETQLITCDSAEKKSTADYKLWGLNARNAEKGPGSVEAGIHWLQQLNGIEIDPIRCPKTYEEFYHYELELDKEGEPINDAFPDCNNHSIDATRYAMERVSKRRGN